MPKYTPKRRRGVLESFLSSNFDENSLRKASQLANEIAQPQTSDKERASDQVCDHISNQVSDPLTTGLTDGQTTRIVTRLQSRSQARSQSRSQNKPDEQTLTKVHFNPDHKSIYLSRQQLSIYDFLLTQNHEGFISAAQISASTGIPKPTIHKSLRKLRARKALQYTKYQKNGRQGFVYSINKNVVIDRSQQQLAQNPYFQGYTVGQTLGNRVGQTVCITKQNSSSLYNKTTTTEEIQNILSNEPELGYWCQKGLTVKQIENWMQHANCSLESMIQYLCYCRFEMVDLGLEDSKPVKKVFDWFFRILERTGAYPKPKGYKSYQQKQLESERQLVEQKEKEAREAEELYRRKVQADQDKKFWDMMNEPEGDLYKQCYDSFSSFQKKHTSGKAFDLAMRAAFDNLIEKGTSEFNKVG
jgi:hypothetical protein